MDHDDIESLRQRHPAWRLLRAGNAPLVLSFLGSYFVQDNRGAVPVGELTAALDDHLYVLNRMTDGDARYPKQPRDYLDDWAAAEAAFLRRFYPVGDDQVHYEVTPAFEKAYAWVQSLVGRPFVGTESRLHTVVDLLRQIVHGTEANPQVRLTELLRRRAEIDEEIAAVEAGKVALLDHAGVRDRYQQLAATARELLSDFREVEENFRLLDRAARAKIAAWSGSKGELLAELVGSRSDIAGSDQGRTFQAFYDFLLSDARQDELAELLRRASDVDSVVADRRLRTVHHDWSEAAERAQRTVRQVSEQLRRFLDDQVWLENRRVFDLVRAVEAAALEVRHQHPAFGLEVDQPGIAISLPFDRPLYQPPLASNVDSLIPPAAEEDLPGALLLTQTFVDAARLAGQVRSLLPPRSSALLEDIIELYPVEQGAAELVGYLALDDEELTVELDEFAESVVEYPDPADPDRTRRARLPRATVRRA